MFSQKGVLLGLAEVRMPLRHLQNADLIRISHVCYRKLLELPAMIDDETVNCIGVVDSFYALQEVRLTIEEDICKIWSKNDLILRHNLKNVLVAVRAEDNNRRVIVVSKTENFGQAAVVIQLMDKKAADQLIEQMIRVKSNVDSRKDNYFKRGAGSFGKSVHKKLHGFLSSISTHHEEGGARLRIPRTVSAPVSPFELSEEDYFSSEADEDLSSQEEESNFVLRKSLNIEKTDIPSLQNDSISPIEAEIEFLLESERKYLNSIHNLLSIQREIENTNSILEYPIGMFDNVNELLSLHSKLYSDFISWKYDISKLCSILIANKGQFDVYISFISNIPTVEKILEMNRQIITKRFPSLIEDLRKPRMRLNFYVLTLESLLKKAPMNTHDTINKCILILKNKLKEADTRLVIDSIHGVPFNLHDYGKVVFSSELTVKRANGLLRRRYQAILLENVLVIGRGSPESSDYVMCFSLLHMQLVHQIRGLFIHLKMRTYDKSSVLIFKAATIKLQQKWMDMLQSQIHTANTEYLRTPLGKSKGDHMSNKVQEITIPEINIIDYDNQENSYSENNHNALSVSRKVPPLSFWAAFTSVEHLIQIETLHSYDENLLAFVKSARDMDINEDMGAIKNQKAKETIILLKEYYVKRIVPSVNLSLFSNEDILYSTLEYSADYFKNLIMKLAYYFSVISYESYSDIPKVFLLAVETVLYLRNALICRKRKTEDERKEYDNLQRIFYEAILISNNKLKRKYISNIPPRLSMNFIYEGVLTLHPHTKMAKKLYVILTEDELFGFEMQENNFLLEININLDGAVISISSEELYFQVTVKNSNNKKEKYDFGCSTIKERSEWILSLEGISNKDSKIIKG